MTSKQRAYLRGLANTLEPIVHAGKGGISDAMIKQADDALTAREIIKGRVLENSMLSPREAAEELAPLTRSEVVQVIGTKFVLYRPSHKKDKADKMARDIGLSSAYHANAIISRSRMVLLTCSSRNV